MAVSIKKNGEKRSILSVSKKTQEKQGKGYATAGTDLTYGDIPRLPTGIFDLDNAIGGGFPKGKITTIYGKESSGKSMIALKALAQAQLAEPEAYQVILDLELTHDDVEWLSNVVPNPEKLLVFRAETAEDAVDKAEAIVKSEDVNYFMLDSLAMLATKNELDSAADKMAVGGPSAIIGKMYRKLTASLTEAGNEGRYPTVVVINQLRFKIGQMFGNPETQVGGMAPKHMSSLTLKVYGKDAMGLTEKQGFCVTPELPSWKEINVTVEKKKVFTASKKCDFKLCVAPTSDGYMPFDSPHWGRLEAYLKSEGLIVQEKKGYKVAGLAGVFKTLKEIRECAMEDPELDNYLRGMLYNHRKTMLLGDMARLAELKIPGGYDGETEA